MIAKLEGHKVLNNKTRTKDRTPTINESENEQYTINNRTTVLERTVTWVYSVQRHVNVIKDNNILFDFFTSHFLGEE